MDEKIRDLRERARAAIAETAQSLGELNDIRVKFLGKKGEMTALLRSMSALAQEERPRIGKIVNEARAELEELLAAKSEELAQRELADKIAAEQIDVTLPGRTARGASAPAHDHARPHQEDLPADGLYDRGGTRDRERLL